jgi:hypothetical protein
VCLFGDVFVRRVALDYAYPLKWLVRQLKPGETAQDVERKESLQRLRSKKSEVAGEMRQARAASRFEVTDVSDTQTLDDALGGKTSAQAQQPTASGGPRLAQPAEQEGYTSRLLAAKKAAQKRAGDRDQNQNQ